MENSFKDNLKEFLKEINIDITLEQTENFYKFMNLLLEWNEKINLTALTSQEDIILKHFVDSLTVLKYIKSKESIVDIGTGAGFPGIPIALMYKDNNITLVDSLNKRINFLEEVKRQMNIKNVVTIHTRAEEFGQNKQYRENFDIAVSRAVANLSVLAEYLIPLVKLGGKIICMKGSSVLEEINNSKLAIKELGGEIKQIEEFYLPRTDMKRNVIIIEKVKNTPKKYPRKAGTPSKQPIS